MTQRNSSLRGRLGSLGLASRATPTAHSTRRRLAHPESCNLARSSPQLALVATMQPHPLTRRLGHFRLVLSWFVKMVNFPWHLASDLR